MGFLPIWCLRWALGEEDRFLGKLLTIRTALSRLFLNPRNHQVSKMDVSYLILGNIM